MSMAEMVESLTLPIARESLTCGWKGAKLEAVFTASKFTIMESDLDLVPGYNPHLKLKTSKYNFASGGFYPAASRNRLC